MATTQHSSSPDSNLSANQPLLAPPPILFPSVPSAAQNPASSQAFGHRFDQEQAPALVTTRTCPGSPGQQDSPHQNSQSLLATKEEMRPAVNCSRAKKSWARAKCFQSQAPICVSGKRWLRPLGCSPFKIAPQSFPQGTPLFLKGDGGPPLPSLQVWSPQISSLRWPGREALSWPLTSAFILSSFSQTYPLFLPCKFFWGHPENFSEKEDGR